GGIYAAKSVTIRNSIISDNQRSNCYGTLNALGRNVIETVGDCSISGNGVVTEWTAHLGPLHDNGGATLTFALDKNSPAIDAGDCVDSAGITVMVDQRGEPRPQGDGCDIGAFESPYTSTFTIFEANIPWAHR